MRKVIGIGETVLDIVFRQGKVIAAIPGGSTLNSLISLGRSGVGCRFISETGDDLVGQQIVDFLRQNGVDSSLVMRYKGTKSPLSLAFLDQENNAQYVFYKDHEHDQLQFSLPEIQPDDIVIFGSYYALNPVIRSQVRQFLQHARQAGAILYYDVNFRASHQHEIDLLMPNLEENLRLAHIVRGSDEDFQLLFGLDSDTRVYKERIMPYCRHFIYTRGSRPVEAFGPGIQSMKFTVRPIKARSTIGAGDNFNAGFLFELLCSDIRRSQIERGLTERQWVSCLRTASKFSAACCRWIYNYVPENFGADMARRLNG